MNEVSRLKLQVEKKEQKIAETSNSLQNSLRALGKSILSPRYIEQILSAMDKTLIVVSPQGEIQWLNNATLKILGYKKEELIGKNFEAFVEGSEFIETPFKSLVIDPLANKKNVNGIKLICLCKGGGKVTLLFSTSAMCNQSEELQSIICVATNISEQEHGLDKIDLINKELTDKLVSLKCSNQELDDFAYIVSHDLKEPIRGIQILANYVIEDHRDEISDGVHDELQRLIGLTQHMRNLIDSILYYSRVGRTQLAFRDTDLNETINEVLQRLGEVLKQANVTVHIARPLPTIFCDHAKIGEVFYNLISNAIKYNDKVEKQIEIGWQEAEESETRQSAVVNGLASGGTVFYVRDNGVGIRQRHQQKVFGLFKQLQRNVEGDDSTGVGLTFTKKIVERHRGKIWLESTYGEGSTFYFSIDVEASDIPDTLKP